VSRVAELRSSRELLFNLTQREIRGKFKRTVLGQAWSLVNPISQMLIYTLVFGFFLRNDPGRGNPSGLHVFALWLSAGLLPWLYLQNVINGGLGALVGNSNLILKVYFPREALVIASCFSFLFTHVIEMSVLVAALVLFGGNPFLYLPATIFFMLLMTAFGLGLAFMLSVANVYFRDTQHFVGIFLQLWFYLTPIIYPISVIKTHTAQRSWLLPLYRLNPLERFSEVFRNTLYDERWPSLSNTLFLTVVSVVVLVIGWQIFNRYSGGLAEEL
jgi:ABC-type polysaccharide/polyol phosphate export permease